MTESTKDSETQAHRAGRESGRRSAVKKIVLTSGIVTSTQLSDLYWTKPVVESVVLPAHAQTSTSEGDVGGY